MRNVSPLPLWNKEQTDVLPEYQLSYGHVLCQTPLVMQGTVRVLAKYLGLGTMVYAGPVDNTRLPMNQNIACRTLGTLELANLLVAKSGNYYAVFAPHLLFLRSKQWIDWNKKQGGLMAYVTRLNVTEHFYIIFENGSRMFDATTNGDQLRVLEDMPILITLDREKIYHDPGSKPQIPEAVGSMLQHDVRIVEENSEIRISTLFAQSSIASVTHYVFQRTRV